MEGITSLVGPRIRNESFRQYNYLDYPPVVRDSIRDAFATKRVVYSSYWEIPYDSTSPNTVIIYPFTLNEKEYALLARISLSRLLEESVPNILRSDYEFSLMNGTELIAGNALYNPLLTTSQFQAIFVPLTLFPLLFSSMAAIL